MEKPTTKKQRRDTIQFNFTFSNHSEKPDFEYTGTRAADRYDPLYMLRPGQSIFCACFISRFTARENTKEIIRICKKISELKNHTLTPEPATEKGILGARIVCSKAIVDILQRPEKPKKRYNHIVFQDLSHDPAYSFMSFIPKNRYKPIYQLRPSDNIFCGVDNDPEEYDKLMRACKTVAKKNHVYITVREEIFKHKKGFSIKGFRIFCDSEAETDIYSKLASRQNRL